MLFKNRFYLLATLLSISVFAESFAYTYMQQEGSTYYYSSSILYFLSGILICVLPLFSTGKSEEKKTRLLFINKSLPWLLAFFFIALLVDHIALLVPLFKLHPVSKEFADMIPTIQLACKRFLHGQKVYGPAPEIWPTSIIPYLPMMWIPFLPSVIFHFDPRWITFSALFIGLLLCLIPVIKTKKTLPILPTIITALSLFLVHNYFLYKYDWFWWLAQEQVVTAFYLLLGFALLRKNYWLIGVAITCCVLSRYSLML